MVRIHDDHIVRFVEDPRYAGYLKKNLKFARLGHKEFLKRVNSNINTSLEKSTLNRVAETAIGTLNNPNGLMLESVTKKKLVDDPERVVKYLLGVLNSDGKPQVKSLVKQMERLGPKLMGIHDKNLNAIVQYPNLNISVTKNMKTSFLDAKSKRFVVQELANRIDKLAKEGGVDKKRLEILAKNKFNTVKQGAQNARNKAIETITDEKYAKLIKYVAIAVLLIYASGPVTSALKGIGRRILSVFSRKKREHDYRHGYSASSSASGYNSGSASGYSSSYTPTPRPRYSPQPRQYMTPGIHSIHFDPRSRSTLHAPILGSSKKPWLAWEWVPAPKKPVGAAPPKRKPVAATTRTLTARDCKPTEIYDDIAKKCYVRHGQRGREVLRRLGAKKTKYIENENSGY